MRVRVLALCLLSGINPLLSQTVFNQQWLTYYEKSNFLSTPRYAETIAYCKRLAAASPWVRYTPFGVSAQGRDLPLIILSKERAFTPEAAARTQKAIILIQSGIHAGEIDGKDASLMLMRDIAITRKYAGMLDSTIVLFIPILNVDGHERFDAYNRINQNGPEEMGWRVNAQNLNLNRDYMKADSPEMRALLTLFRGWLPDMYVDCHVTDGIDFQYDVTYAVELGSNIDPRVSEWMKQQLLPPVLHTVEAAGHGVYDYVFPREVNDITSGISSGAATPRFSTGYSALQNRPALLIETHMLKSYRTRVDATYHLLRGVIETINGGAASLRSIVRAADDATVMRGKTYDLRRCFPLVLGVGPEFHMRTFLGFRTRQVAGPVSGVPVREYTREPVTLEIPFFDHITVDDSASVPLAYICPPEWTFVPHVLQIHGVRVERLAEPVTLEVESYRFTDLKWRDRPYEGRQVATFKTVTTKEVRQFPAGSVIVRMAQRAANVAFHLLEPRGPDSFVSWGFFNAIFERKEYAEPYILEEIGGRLLETDSVMHAEFQKKLAADSAFARSPRARLDWVYDRSPWRDRSLNEYPVARVISPVNLRTAPLAGE